MIPPHRTLLFRDRDAHAADSPATNPPQHAQIYIHTQMHIDDLPRTLGYALC